MHIPKAFQLSLFTTAHFKHSISNTLKLEIVKVLSFGEIWMYIYISLKNCSDGMSEM